MEVLGGGRLHSVHQPITADETLPTEQLELQLASCKCNYSYVRRAINTKPEKKKRLKRSCEAYITSYNFLQPLFELFSEVYENLVKRAAVLFAPFFNNDSSLHF